MKLRTLVVLCALLAWWGAPPAQAQSISSTDLAGTWSVFQLATPAGPFTGAAIRTYRGALTLDDSGTITAGMLLDNQQPVAGTFDVAGTLTITPAGVIDGTLAVEDQLGDAGDLDVREARLLVARHTIIGVATMLGQPAFFALVKQQSAPFALDADLAGTWAYHEITPSNQLLPGISQGDATWSTGTIAIQAGTGAADATLRLADGTQRPSSFGSMGIGATGAVTGSAAALDAQMSSDAGGSPAQRDLILGLTAASDVGAPGFAALTKILPSPPTYVQADLAGPWRVYLQRAEAHLSGGTWQTGVTTFSATGTFTGATLAAFDGTTRTLSTGSLLVSANGSVTGTLTAAGTLGDTYTLRGTMRASKDLVTAVVTVLTAGRTVTHHGLVTLVREPTVFDLGQSAYSVVEGGTATVTVLRTGNRAGVATVHYEATGGTAPLADYLPASGTLTFASGIASASVTVKTVANTVVDGNRSINLVLSNPTGTGALLGATGVATLTIVDEDKAGTVKLGAATYALTESGKNAVIAIQRSGGAASGVVVQFATSDGTAQAGRDYTAVTGSVTFNTGETTKTVLVPITDTPIVDGSRSFTFTLTGSPPPSATIGSPASATVTIGDLDVAGTLQFSAATYSTSEPPVGTGSITITVTRTGGLAGGVLVNFATADGTATAGADYTATGGTLTFSLGNTSQTFTIPIAADALVEGDETVLLALSGPAGGATLGAQKTAVLTIRDAQHGVQFSAPTFAAAESAATATITVVRTGSPSAISSPATVRYSTSDGTAKAGTSYRATAGTLTFAAGATKATFMVPLLADKLVSEPQTVLLLLSSPFNTSLGPLTTAVLTIGNVDSGGAVKLAAPAFSITEAAGAAVITVSRSGGTAGGVSVDYAAADQACGSPPCAGQAQGGFDYQAVTGTVTFGVGETTKSILIPVTNDAQVNGNRTFLVGLSNPQGGATLATPSSAVVTIVDDDKGGVFQLSAAAYSATEPAAVSTTATITVTRTGTSLAGASVQFATGNGTALAGTDYAATVTTLVFGAGETSKTVSVPILVNPAPQGNKTVNLSLSNPGGGATLGTITSAVLTIIDSVATARFSAASYTVTEGAAATITVLRGGPATGTLKVDYITTDGTATAGTDYTAKVGTLTFGPGVSSLSFTVPTANNADQTDGRTVSLTLTANGPGAVASPGTATLTIKDNDAAGTFDFGAATYSVAEGGAAPQILVNRSGGSGGTVVVAWSATGGTATGGALPTTPGADYAPASGFLTFGPGVTSLKIPLTIVNDTIAEDPETIVLGLTISSTIVPGAAVGATTPSATVTIADNDNGGTLQFALATQTVAENVAGGKALLVVTRTGTALASGVLVDYAATAGDLTAIALPDGTLTFAAGQTMASIPVGIVANTTPEPDRLVTITLSNARSSGLASGANAPALGGPTSTVLKIVDDEARVQFAVAAPAVTEGGTATITVTRSGSMTGTATVGYATGGGTATAGVHYTAAAGTLTFPPATASRSFAVTTLDDGVAAGSRTVGLTLSNPGGASIGGTNPATLTIADRESAGSVQFATASATVVEGLPGDPGRTLRVTVTRAGANLVGPVTVGWSATGGSATAGTDYTPASGTLTFEGAATSQTFELVALDDGVAEGTETIVLSLDPPTGGATLGAPSAMTVFVVDAQQSVAFSSPTFAVGETTALAAISVMRVGIPTGPVTVTATTVLAAVDPSLQAVAGTDYTSVSTTLTFAAGEIVKSFSVPILTANALTRNGNRIVGLELSAPVGATLVGASTAQLTILDFRPDLVVVSVGTPGNTLTGKTLSAPTSVKNLGQVASPAFRVGVFMARDTGSLDDALPGAGTLVAQRDVPALAAGASTALPTQLAIADDLPAGDYYVSAVANFNLSVTEADPTNNGLSSSPSKLKVSSSLSKFQSASASFNLASAPSGPTALNAPLDVGTCDVAGSVNLTGSFTVATQQQDTASGTLDLSGSFNGEAVRFLVGFTGTADPAGTVSATLTSIAVSGAFSATGSGTPPGTFSGTLNAATLSGTATGSLHTATGGDCVFTGPLSAVAQTSFVFRFGTRVSVGTFGFANTPENVPPQVDAPGYAAKFHVLFDSALPDPSTVRFTGPTGSGVSAAAADPGESHFDDDGSGGSYVSPPRSGIAPGGVWSVLYKGIARTFNVPSFDANRSLVVILPTVTVDTGSGTLTRVDWIYQDRFGNRVTGTPSSIKGLRLQVWMNRGGDDQPESPSLPPTVTSYTFPAGGVPEWAGVNAIVFEYEDLLGNEYQLEYQKTFSVQVETRLENIYAGFAPPTGSRERLINAFVNVPFLAVEDVNGVPCGSQTGPPFLVSIQNRVGVAGVAPYETATCMDRSSSAFFPNGTVPVDIYGTRDNLDNYRQTSQSFPALPVGTQFEFNVNPVNSSGSLQTVLTTLKNAEANPTTDFIGIPNPATPTQKPSGFRLADAKLGQNMTVSWTLPTSFAIGNIMLTSNVTAAPPSGGQSPPSFTLPPLTCNPGSIDLPITTTSATFKFPSSCFGIPVTQAQFCIFITGTAAEQEKRTAACWFFEDSQQPGP